MVADIGYVAILVVKVWSMMSQVIMEGDMIKSDRQQYSADIKAWAIKAIDRLRPAVFLGPRQLAGWRFNDTQHVFVVLESMTSQAKFEKRPLPEIEAALKECADADYWYEMEKEYDGHVEDFEENDSVEGEGC